MAKTKRIPPRADHFLRYINDTVLTNLRARAEETKLQVPGIVERAFQLINETATIIIEDIDAEEELSERQ